MKHLKTIAIALLVTISSTVATTAQIKQIKADKSTITWVGKKVTGQHTGNISFQEGTLTFKKNKLTGGNFTVNMTSITCTDLSGEWRDKLLGHLKSDDFFGVDKFKTATLAFKKIKAKGNDVYTISGDLTIKGITNPVSFDLTVNKDKATTTLKINRTKYGIKYGSGSFFDNLGDKTINDDFELTVNLQF